MRKPNTEPGWGPARPHAPEAPAPQNAQPEARRKADTVDILLEGFKERPERPRILPTVSKDETPTPPGGRPAGAAEPFSKSEARAQIVTEPGRRQRHRGAALSVVGGLVVLVTVSLVALRAGGFWPPPSAAPVAPLTSAKLAAPQPAAATQPAATTQLAATTAVAPDASSAGAIASTDAATAKAGTGAPRVAPTASPARPPTSHAPTSSGTDPSDLRGSN